MTTPLKNITDGSWTARWGDHVIHLLNTDQGWCASVWRWTTGGYAERQQLDVAEGLPTAAVAAQWACNVLKTNGASVLLNTGAPGGVRRDLLAFLEWRPAPTSVR